MTADSTLSKRFPFLLTASSGAVSRVLIVDGPQNSQFPVADPDAQTKTFERFEHYMNAKYGDPAFDSADLSVMVRDLGLLPPLAPDLTAFMRAEIAKILNDPKLSQEKRQARVQELRAFFFNAPELQNSTTLRGFTKNGEEIYHYFPRFQIDFSADLLSNSVLDRFSQLVMYIRLTDDVAGKGVRFVDFVPKGSDILEYSRGEFKEKHQLQAKGTAGRSSSDVENTVSGDTTTTETRGVSLGGEVSFTSSEEFTRQLKDALEKQTAGIVENGRALLVQLRSVRHIRIGGTYEFGVMLEIPSLVKPAPHNAKYYVNSPAVELIEPEIVLLGVVRHVYNRGQTGFFNKVPEIENDGVFEQVVIRRPTVTLWSFNQNPWIRPYVFQANAAFTVHVATNNDAATFVVTDTKDDSILATGKGATAKLTIPTADLAHRITAKIDFKPIVVVPTNGSKHVLTATPASPPSFQINVGDTGSKSFSVSYQ